MPKNDFTQVAKYAANQGYLRLRNGGGVTLDGSRNDRFSTQLQDYFKVGAAGNIEEEHSLREPNPDDPTWRFIHNARVARLAAAQAAMERGWKNLGGPKSRVGLPMGNQIVIKEQGTFGQGGYTADFRGGTLHLSSDGNTVVSDTQTVVSIDVVGIECQVRQEKTDEIYGVISVLGPSNSTIVSRRLPAGGTIDMGPDGMRINLTRVPLISRGVLQNYIVWASIVENDSGDVDVIASKIADKFAEVASAAVGALTGASAEAIGESESFKQNLATGLAWVFGSVLGMGDDPYNAESFNVFWGDLKAGSPPVKPDVRRNDDPRTISDWTHQLILSGVDDGGDRGQYAIYFKVWTEGESHTVQAPTQ